MDAYIINSNKSLPELRTYLENCGGCAALKIIYNKTPEGFKETRNTLVICKVDTIEKLKKIEVFSNRVKVYDWNRFYSPNEKENENWDLHITGLSQQFTSEIACNFVRERICQIVPEKIRDITSNTLTDAYTIRFDFASRETGKIQGFGTIVFHESVSDHELKLCKLALHNCPYIADEKKEERRFLSCTWHKNKVASSVSPTQLTSGKHKKMFVRNIYKKNANNTGPILVSVPKENEQTAHSMQTVTTVTETIVLATSTNASLPSLSSLNGNLSSSSHAERMATVPIVTSINTNTSEN